MADNGISDREKEMARGLSAPAPARIRTERARTAFPQKPPKACRSQSQGRPSTRSRSSTSTRRSSYSGSSVNREELAFTLAGVTSASSAALSSISTAHSRTKILPPGSYQPPRPSQRPRPQQLSYYLPKPEHDLNADLHWQINARNPRNWKPRKKWVHTMVPSILALVLCLGATIVVPLRNDTTQELQTSSIVAVLTLSLYVLGLTFGPYLSALGSETLGRKRIYVICVSLYAVVAIVNGIYFEQLPVLLLCRFLGGVFASPAVHMVWTTLEDLWAPDERTWPLTAYATCCFLGLTLGPIVGGQLDLRWGQHTLVTAMGALSIPVVAMKETSKKAILRKQRGKSVTTLIDRDHVTTILVKPLRMVFTEPIVLIFALNIAINSGVLFTVLTTFPAVLAQAEGFGITSDGLSFSGMVVGVVAALVFIILYQKTVYQPRVIRYKEERATEDEKTIQTSDRSSRRVSRFSFANAPYEQIGMGTVNPGRRRSSVIQTLRRLSTPGFRNLETPSPDPQRNIDLAVAAAKYLNSIEANQSRYIMPERILVLLNNKDHEFADICCTLEGYSLKFDKVELARILFDALQKQHAVVAPAPIVTKPSVREATPPRRTFIPPSSTPPPEWCLVPALPAALLITTSLIMLGWTARSGIHWVVPVIAMGLYAFGSLVVFFHTTQYVLDCYGVSHGSAAIAGSTMLSFLAGGVFPLFTQPMYNGLGAGLATSLFGIVSGLVGSSLLGLYCFGAKLRNGSQYKESRFS